MGRVAERTLVSCEVIERLQAKTGLSNERIAARIGIMAKTWARWKKAGPDGLASIPTTAVLTVERALNVPPGYLHELPQPASPGLMLEERLTALEHRIKALEDRLP